MESIAKIATDTGIPVLALIRASKELGLDSWVSECSARRIVEKVGDLFTLSDQDGRKVYKFLLEDPKAREAFRKYAGIEGLVTQQEANQLIEAICRALVKELNIPLRKKVTPIYISRVVMNLGVLDVYRSAGSQNDVQGFVREYVLPYSADLAVQILTRYYTNAIQTMTPQRARGYVEDIKQKHQASRHTASVGGANGKP